MKKSILVFILSLAGKVALPLASGTFTFVNPCQPLVVHSPVPDKYGCYSFTVGLPAGAPPGAVFHWDFGDGATATGQHVMNCYGPVSVTTVFSGTVTYQPTALCGPMPSVGYFSVTLVPPEAGDCVYHCFGLQVSGSTVTLQPEIMIPEMTLKVDFGDGSGWHQWKGEHVYDSCGSYIVSRQYISWFGGDTCYRFCAVNLPCASYPVGVDENSGKVISVFPNPTNENLTIGNLTGENDVVITDLTGRKVLAAHCSQDKDLQLELDGLCPGTYYISIINEDRSKTVVRLIKL